MSSPLELPEIISQTSSLPLEKPQPSEREKTQKRSARFKFKHALILVIVTYLTFVAAQTLFEIHLLNQEIVSLEHHKAELEKANLFLEEEVNNLNDPLYLEQIAREKLLLIKSDEILLITVSSSNKGS